MSYLNPSNRTITAFFDSRTAAQKAADDLASLGIPRGQVQITDGHNSSAAPATESANKSFWEQLKDFFLPHEDRYAYAEGLQRGGFLLSAQVDNTLYDRALGVLDTDGAVNMDEREASWRSSGWEGYRSDEETPGMATGTALGAAAGMASEPTLTTPAPTLADGGIAGYDSSRLATRDTSHRSQRLRSYTMPLDDRSPISPEAGEPFNGERFSPVNDAGRIAEHMDVIASDGVKIGAVDHLDGNQIKLTKSASPDGMHHFIPLTDIDHVDAHVHLTKSAAEARASW